MKFAIAFASAAVAASLYLLPAAERDMTVVPPTAVAGITSAGYCFARERGLDPGRLPPSYLVLQLKVAVSYRNTGNRGLIVPLEHERTVYTAINPNEMRMLKEEVGLFDSDLKIMKDLPSDVGPDSPISPKNDVFTVIPAGGEMTPAFTEEIRIPVTPKGLFKQSPDLRGHRVYVELRYRHRDMSAALGADLSDRWSRFGFPWTGILTTNKITVDVPASPQGTGLCVDTVQLHPVANANYDK